MKKILALFLMLNIGFYSFSQSKGPYRLKTAIDLPVTVLGAGASYFGLKKLRDKPLLDSAFVVTLTPEDIGKFNRGATRQKYVPISTYADMFLYASFATPLLLCADKEIRSDALKVGALYLETMVIMANAYTWGVSATHRIRPYVYNPNVPFEKKLRRGTTNSFYAGHPAAAAASTFFAAKVFSDYHPDSKLRTAFWIAAIVPPSIVAYYRYKGGQHFPTDIIAGIPIGAAIGIIVPHLHKVSAKGNVQIYPTPGGVGMTYLFN